MTKNDWIGIAVYFCTAFLFGASTALLILFIKENSDRCHYYDGKWNKADITRGVISIACALLCNFLISLIYDTKRIF